MQAIANENRVDNMALLTVPLEQDQHISQSSTDKNKMDNNLWFYDQMRILYTQNERFFARECTFDHLNRKLRASFLNVLNSMYYIPP